MKTSKHLSQQHTIDLLTVLQARFHAHMELHPKRRWEDVQAKLLSHPEKLLSLSAMEQTGGEPDVVELDTKTNEIVFCDCSTETPNGRRNVCYDREGQQAREKQGIHPQGNAIDMAAEMGVELLTEEQYRKLQTLGEFDTKTSSWIQTPDDIRKLGGALFVDRRFDHVFVYHNTAQTFYGVRGFRGILRT